MLNATMAQQLRSESENVKELATQLRQMQVQLLEHVRDALMPAIAAAAQEYGEVEVIREREIKTNGTYEYRLVVNDQGWVMSEGLCSAGECEVNYWTVSLFDIAERWGSRRVLDALLDRLLARCKVLDRMDLRDLIVEVWVKVGS